MENIHFTDESGNERELSQFNQKSHVALIWDPNADANTLAVYRAQIEGKQKLWDWLAVKIFILKTVKETITPGMHLYDRYSRHITTLPFDQNLWKNLETEVTYYEARHC